jgi:hypothetical protein
MLFFYFQSILLCLVVGALLGILFNSLAWGVVLALGACWDGITISSID